MHEEQRAVDLLKPNFPYATPPRAYARPAPMRPPTRKAATIHVLPPHTAAASGGCPPLACAPNLSAATATT